MATVLVPRGWRDGLLGIRHDDRKHDAAQLRTPSADTLCRQIDVSGVWLTIRE